MNAGDYPYYIALLESAAVQVHFGLMMPNDHDHDPHTGGDADEETLDMEMTLLALSSSGDVGGPMQDIDLSTLSPEEKRALLAYLRHRFSFAPDPRDAEQYDGEHHAQEVKPTPPRPTHA